MAFVRMARRKKCLRELHFAFKGVFVEHHLSLYNCAIQLCLQDDALDISGLIDSMLFQKWSEPNRHGLDLLNIVFFLLGSCAGDFPRGV